MEREPTLKKAMEPYLAGIEDDINFDPTGNKISLLFLAVLYSTAQGAFSITQEDRLYAKSVVEVLLEYGANPTRHEGENPKYSTPLGLAKTMSEKGKDPEKVYELLLKHSINSATEEVAFENKFTEGAKKVGKGLLKALKGVVSLPKKGLEAAIKVTGGIGSKIADTAMKNKDKKRLAEAKLSTDKQLAEKNKSPSNLKKKFDELPDSAKLRFIWENLPDGLVKNPDDTAKIKTKIAHSIVDYPDPFKTDLYKAVKSLHSYLIKSKPEVDLFNILLSPKYSGMAKILSNPQGLSNDGSELTKQAKIIAYWVSMNKDLKNLKDESGNWKSFSEMSKTVDSLKIPGNTNNSQSTNELRQQVVEALVSLGFSKSESEKYFNSASIPEGTNPIDAIKLVLKNIKR